MKRFLEISFVLGVFYATICACIPISDVVAPQIITFNLQENNIYYYLDTLQFNIAYRDNALLDSAVVEVQKSKSQLPQETDWHEKILYKLQGRRGERKISLQIPPFKTPGKYEVNVVVHDDYGNKTTQKRAFLLEEDRTPPVFENLEIGLARQDDGSYQGCRSETITVRGIVHDNLQVSRLGFMMSSGQSDVKQLAHKSISVDEVFGNSLLIPADAENGQQIKLTFFAADTFQNRVEKDFIINVSCDDVPPEIKVLKTTPALNSKKFTNVTQGAFFSIDSAIVSDNKFIDSVKIFYNNRSTPRKLLHQVEVKAPGPVNLAKLLKLRFEVTDDMAIGETKEITLIASDSAGNRSTPTVVSFGVIEDLPPRIIITDTYLNGKPKTWHKNTFTTVSPGDQLTLRGKIEELNKLKSVQMRWGKEKALRTVLSLDTFEVLPFDFTPALANKNFLSILKTAKSGTVYQLEIRAIDSKNQLSVVSYRFKVK